MLFAARSSMPRDLASAYVATAARTLAWFVVAALVYRRLGADYFAMLALVRATIGLLNYTTLGLSPAMVHHLSRAQAGPGQDAEDWPAMRRIYAAGRAVAAISVALAGAALVAYVLYFLKLHRVPAAIGESVRPFVFWFGTGVIARLASDPAGAVLQINHRITLDNLFIAAADALWALASATALLLHPLSLAPFQAVGIAFLASGMLLFVARAAVAARLSGARPLDWTRARWPVIRSLLAFGVFVTLAQLADYLYAPTDYILISRLLSVGDLAAYAPAVQVDAALLLLVTGLSAVLLPKSALAHAAGEVATVRRYYLRGTALSVGLLLLASLAVWTTSTLIFRLWFGDTLPATRAILPLVLIHTLIGGSSAVGRSILLGTGHVKPFTASVLLAGVVNVLLSYVFVRYCGWGLTGIILGTLIAVTGRCAIWMPWYTLRTLANITRS